MRALALTLLLGLTACGGVTGQAAEDPCTKALVAAETLERRQAEYDEAMERLDGDITGPMRALARAMTDVDRTAKECESR